MDGAKEAATTAYTSEGLGGDHDAGTASATGPANRVVIPTINPTLIIITIRSSVGCFNIKIFFPNKKGARGAILDVGNGDFSFA